MNNSNIEFGKLFVVGTPIGNLQDITKRSEEILRSVDFILCEDTRVTSVLLKEIGISKKLYSFNAQSEEKKIEIVLQNLVKGESAALVSDAGTPCISDPGTRLVNKCHQVGIEVIGIPGPNAAILALSIAGVPTDSFIFEGFIPQKKGRQKKMKELADEDRTIILYESTYRIEKLLNELNEYMPDRFVVVCRELTKKFEEVWRGTPQDLLEDFKDKITKGEFVVIIASRGFSV